MQEADSSLDTINVLMIEDSPDDVYLIKRLITLAVSMPVIKLSTASTLQEGMERLDQGGIDVVLLDLTLPDSTGLETLLSLQRRWSHLPVVVQTGVSDEDLGMEAVRLGAQDYLIKGEANIQLLVRSLRYAIERNNIEEELRQHRTNLEALVAERTADLQRTNEKLQREMAERERAEQRALDLAIKQERARVLTNFVRAASHDFRTPLSTINTSLYLIRRVKDTKGREQHLSVIEMQANRLARLVDGMLRLLQVESNPELHFRSIHLNDLIRDVALHVYSYAAEKQVEISLDLADDLPLVDADQAELSYALVEITENAINYSHQDGKVILRTCSNQTHVTVEIEDYGIGISDQDMPYIFELLYRADKARSAETGGPGLGLPIVQKIVAAHGGTIDVVSEENRGTTFRITLPRGS
ncbi:MAG TPA: ATP-binding protein [Aggregatilinea sp.]|uniref:sensor histidine kinase n=1 Tax=Aggregatilinea sp. TaxID=2806333 RepID=UPI002B97A616|nr:ATP-binding protein [Aggregatilinea sp.]HML23171.1 ATP-binding protein [Aggregatilinea sp.]